MWVLAIENRLEHNKLERYGGVWTELEQLIPYLSQLEFLRKQMSVA